MVQRRQATDLFLSIVPSHVGERLLSSSSKKLRGHHQKAKVSEAVANQVVKVTKREAEDGEDGAGDEEGEAMGPFRDTHVDATVVYIMMTHANNVGESTVAVQGMTLLCAAVDRALSKARGMPIIRTVRGAVQGRAGFGKARSAPCDLAKVENHPNYFLVIAGLGDGADAAAVPHELWALAGARCIMTEVELAINTGGGGVSLAGTSVTIGVSTGRCTGGMNGTHNLSYSLYGDTVNMAARLASLAMSDQAKFGNTVLSEPTMTGLQNKALAQFFAFDKKSEVAIKGKTGFHTLGVLTGFSVLGRTVNENNSSSNNNNGASGRGGGGGAGGGSDRSAGSARFGGKSERSEGPVVSSRLGSSTGFLSQRSRLGLFRSSSVGSERPGASEAGATSLLSDGVEEMEALTSLDQDAVSFSIQDATTECARNIRATSLTFKNEVLETDFEAFRRRALFSEVRLIAAVSLIISLCGSAAMLASPSEVTSLDGRGGGAATPESDGAIVVIAAVIAALAVLFAAPFFGGLASRERFERSRWPGLMLVTLSTAVMLLGIVGANVFVRVDAFTAIVFLLPGWFCTFYGSLPFREARMALPLYISAIMAVPVVFVASVLKGRPRLPYVIPQDWFMARDPLQAFPAMALYSGVMLVSAATLYLREAALRVQFFVLLRMEDERERIQDLVDNSIPAHIRPRLHARTNRSQPVAEHFEDWCVCFIDIVGFTTLSSAMSAADIFKLLSDFFTELDAIAAACDVFKIGTIGDAYIVGSNPARAGLGKLGQLGDSPVVLAEKMARFAVRALAAAEAIIGSPRKVRVGCDQGVLNAGIIGKALPVYRSFGPALERANLLESLSEPGSILISDNMAQNVRLCSQAGQFLMTKRGPQNSNAVVLEGKK
jgi:class 3 adenylate cyclase